MSKWKENAVTIIQAFQGARYDSWFGLGDDSKLYIWDKQHGAWEKFWNEQDLPAQ